jgi:hypothetical protein
MVYNREYMEKSYRSAHDNREIVGLLGKVEFPGDHILWQNIAGLRPIYKIIGMELMPAGGEVKIIIDEIPHKFTVKLPIYLKMDHDETVFKVDVLQVFDNVIMAKLPEEVKTVEHRTNPRLRFKPSDNKLITLSYEIDIVSKARGQGIFQVIDISKGGISIVCGHQKITSLLNAYDIRLVRLGHLSMLLHVPVRLVYYQTFKYKRDGHVTKAYRVGFKFNGNIQSEIFQRYVLSK